MVTICGPGCGRLVCDECGRRDPVWSSPEEATAWGLRNGWEVIASYCLCPRCSEAGAQWGLEAAADVVVTLADGGGEPVDAAFIVEG
jgi:hypothetical protein